MAHQRCAEEDAEAILSNLKMEGRGLAGATTLTEGEQCKQERKKCKLGKSVKPEASLYISRMGLMGKRKAYLQEEEGYGIEMN